MDAWMQDLERAVVTVDEGAIWTLMDAQASNEEAHNLLAERVSRMAFNKNGVNAYCELFMMPVIVPASLKVFETTEPWKASREQIKKSLEAWFPQKARFTVFSNLVPMDWVTTWTPAVLRAHLQQLIPGYQKAPVTFQTAQIQLPESAPRLGFVVIGLTSLRSWPELGAVDALADRRLKETVKFTLQLAAGNHLGADAPAPTVYTPERVQFAVTDGICQWLLQLHEATGISGWTVMPSLASRDVVKISLQLNDEKTFYSQFTVRLHQIGTQGLQDILVVLKSLAPMLDSFAAVNDSGQSRAPH